MPVIVFARVRTRRKRKRSKQAKQWFDPGSARLSGYIEPSRSWKKFKKMCRLKIFVDTTKINKSWKNWTNPRLISERTSSKFFFTVLKNMFWPHIFRSSIWILFAIFAIYRTHSTIPTKIMMDHTLSNHSRTPKNKWKFHDHFSVFNCKNYYSTI